MKNELTLRDYFSEAEKRLAKKPGAVISFKSGGRVMTAIRCADGTIEISGLGVREHSRPVGAQIRTIG